MPPTAALAHIDETEETFVHTAADGAAFRYCIDERGEACITRCLTATPDMSIPDELDGFPVTELSDGSFSGLHALRTLVCPARLRHIGAHAFENCINLAEVVFNDRLESIGSEAFFLCQALEVLELPATLRKLGANIAGAQNAGVFTMRGSSAPMHTAEIRIAANSPYLLADASGLLYEKTEDGLVLIDGSYFEGSTLAPRPETIAIGVEALAQNHHIVEAVLPHGCKRIEAGAFRGCLWLSRVTLPDTLEEIQQAAFSCTTLKSIRLPKSCVRIHSTALATGPVIEGLPSQPYASKLLEIEVDEHNPRYCMVGPVLCRRICENQLAQGETDDAGQDSRCLVCECEDSPIAENAQLEAIMCPARADVVDLRKRVMRIAPSTFSGTGSIKHLMVRSDVRIAEGQPLLPHASCDRITIEPADGTGGQPPLDLEIPTGTARARILSAPLTGPHIDISALLSAYDHAVLNEADGLAQARQMVGRLAQPLALDEQTRSRFTDAVRTAFDAICVHFGARNYWAGFERLADAGFLDEGNIPGAVNLLAEYGDATAAGYLLEMKRRRFGAPAWDFAL